MVTASVIIPTYEDRDVLPRAVESVLSQTLSDLELIVVDDGSTDGTAAVLDAIDDERLTYLAHETNRGASAARNTGIEAATGRYVAFLDADDEWLPAKLERQIALLVSRPPEWVAAYCAVEPVFPGNSGVRGWLAAGRAHLADLVSRRRHTEGAEGGAELIGDVLADDLHTSAGSTLVVRRRVAEAIGGFDESFERFQDPEFLVRVLREGKLACVDEPLVRRHVSGDPPADRVRAADEHYLETFADEVARLEAEGRDVTGAHHYMLARHYLREGRFLTAMEYLRSARRPTPRQVPGLVSTVLAGVGHRVRV